MSEKPKIGEGHAQAMLRQGLKELRGAFYTQSNVAQPTEYGMFGTKTPGEVADDRRGDHQYDLDMEEERMGEQKEGERSPSIAERVQAAKDRAEHQPSEVREMERD